MLLDKVYAQDPTPCWRCGERSCIYDKVLMLWRCLSCGWRDGRRGTL